MYVSVCDTIYTGSSIVSHTALLRACCAVAATISAIGAMVARRYCVDSLDDSPEGGVSEVLICPIC
eukprot:SAG25_NODE_12936_length_273_cov_1.017241_1_plen_65_part_01